MRSEEVVRLASASPPQFTQKAAWTTKGTAGLLWVAVVAGPVTGGVALANASTEPQPQREEQAGALPVRDGTGPAEYATRTIGSWIAGEDITDDTATEADTLQAPSGDRRAVDLRVAHVAELRPGIWAITVSGRIAETLDEANDQPQQANNATDTNENPTDEAEQEQVSGVRFWRIAVAVEGAADAGGTSDTDRKPNYAVLGLPAEVAGPSTAQPPDLPYGTAVSGAPGELGRTVEGFVFAYLTGLESVDRYIAPRARIAAPGGYLEAGVESMAASGGVDLNSRVEPREGRTLQLLVTVGPVTQAGDAPALQYALTVTARDGRWEIADIAEAPLTAPDAQQRDGGGR